MIISTAVKVWVQMELARLTILTGKPALEGYRQVSPRLGRAGWINYLWIGMDFAKMFQRGGSSAAPPRHARSSGPILWPIAGEPLSRTSLTVWTVVIVVVTITWPADWAWGSRWARWAWPWPCSGRPGSAPTR